MFKWIHFAATLAFAALAGTSTAWGQSLTGQCREWSKLFTDLAPMMAVLEAKFPELEITLKNKLLPLTSGQLQETAVSAMQAQQEFLSALRKYHASIEVLNYHLQRCAKATGSTNTEAQPAIPATPPDLKSSPAAVPPAQTDVKPAAEAPTGRSETANLASPFREAEAARNRGDFATAIQTYRSLAEQGHAAAQLKLGVMYVKAQGVPQDFAVAQMWFKRAAGNPAADQATRDDAIYNIELIAKRLAIAGQEGRQQRENGAEDASAARQTPQVRQQQTTTETIQEKILSDNMKKYEFARRMGGVFEMCFALHQIVENYRNLRDEENYRKWDQIETRDCANGGFRLPR